MGRILSFDDLVNAVKKVEVSYVSRKCSGVSDFDQHQMKLLEEHDKVPSFICTDIRGDQCSTKCSGFSWDLGALPQMPGGVLHAAMV